MKVASVVFLVAIVLATVVKERARLTDAFVQVGFAALAFNPCSMTVGYLLPLVARLPHRQATLAITIAMSPLLLNNPTMAVPAAVYSVIMFATAALFSIVVSRRDPKRQDVVLRVRS